MPKKIIPLATYRYPAISGKPTAVIIHLNGFQQHSNHFAHIARSFALQNFEVISFDYKGFGQSEGNRGCIEGASDLVNQTLKFIKLAKSYYGIEHNLSLGPLDTPLYLVG